MKKSSTKLAIRKSTIATFESKAQEMIRGGFQAVTSESCPGDQCPTQAKTCNANGLCPDTTY